MSPLTQALKEIDYWINNSKSWHAKRIRSFSDCPGLGIRPGLEREMIELFSEEFDFQFSEEIYELYQWHNGLIQMGDMANPVFFVPLEDGTMYIDKKNNFLYLALFIGDDTFYLTPGDINESNKSPIYHYNGRILPASKWGEASYSGDFCVGSYSPSITNLMQAIAECAIKYDGISAYHMEMDMPFKEIYPDSGGYKRISILSPIYDKYGVTGDYSGLWR